MNTFYRKAVFKRLLRQTIAAVLPAAMVLLAGCAATEAPGRRFPAEAGSGGGSAARETRPASERDKKDAAALDAWLESMKADPREALKSYGSLSASMPGRWQVDYDAAVAYLRLNEPDKAVTELNAALGKDADQRVVYGALGTAYASMGKKDESAEAFKKAFERGAGAGVLINAAAASLDAGRLDEAAVYCRAAEALEPKNPALRYDLGLLMYKKGLYRRALEEFDRAAGGGLDRLKVSLARAHALLQLGRYEEALGLLENAARADTNYFYLNKQIGIIYELYLGNMKKAYEYYNLYLSVVKEDRDVESWIEVVKTRLAKEAQ